MTKRKKDEGDAPRVKNPNAVALGKQSHAVRRERDPKGYRADQQKACPAANEAMAGRPAETRAKKQATWLAKRIAFLQGKAYALAKELERQHAQADEEGLPKPREGTP